MALCDLVVFVAMQPVRILLVSVSNPSFFNHFESLWLTINRV